MRSSVSMVMRLPSRRRATSLPSFTARRPKVDSAMSDWRQNSVIWLRISSFFMMASVGRQGGEELKAAVGLFHPAHIEFAVAGFRAVHHGRQLRAQRCELGGARGVRLRDREVTL